MPKMYFSNNENKRRTIFLIIIFLISIFFMQYIIRIYRERSLLTSSYEVIFSGDLCNYNSKDYFYVPYVENIENKELENKINENLRATFYDWLPELFTYAIPMELSEYKNNGRYLSIDIVYTIFSNRTANLSICNTVDMKTGEIVYLDDIIEVNDELVSMLLTEGTLKTVFDWMRGLEDVYYLQDVLDYYDPEMIRDNLEKCSEPYTKECGVHKPTFYIKNERLYFINLLGIESESYVEIDSIRDKLKIDL